ncbi:MAG TPA: amidohydrolase family protein [Candidatus Sulfotelmatobacter sp.]|nr:amidohydrolase family protein [Candidatus Sulfotelmatobacter sp.]
MLIVDAQVHLWAADTRDRPWPKRETKPHRSEPLGRAELLREMDEAGVRRVVIVPPSWEGDRNDLALEAARLEPDRFAVMGRLPLEKPESRGLIEHWKRQPGMLGARFTFHTSEQRPWLTDGTADWLWSAAERAQVPLMIHVPGSLAKVDPIAARHPGLKLVIDHLGRFSNLRDAEAFADLPLLLALARRPNVAVKASALPCLSTAPYPYRNLHTYVRQAFDAFGPSRVFWGTDLSRLPCRYRQAVTMFTEELPWLAGADLEQVMGKAICAWLGWPA